ncbi:MAG: EAL domain-containing protein [Beijerinckiaceae bacterium]
MKSSISHKLILPFAMFLAPLVFLLFALVQTHQSGISTAKNELRGVPTVLSALRLSQTLVTIELEASEKQRRQIRTALQDLRQHSEIWKSHPLVTAPMQRSVDSLETLINQFSLSIADVGEPLEALKSLIRAVADSSELILDPDLDSYYLMDTLVVQYPVMLTTLLEIKRDAYSDQLNKSMSNGFRDRKLAHAQILSAITARLTATFTSVLQHAKDPDAIRPFRMEAMRHEIALGAAIQHLSQPHREEWLQQLLHDTVISGEMARETAAEELTRVLEMRIDKFTKERNKQLFISLFLFLLAATVLLYLTNNHIAQPVRKLTTAMLALADGNLGARIPKSRENDEIGAMSRAVRVFKESALQKQLLEVEKLEASAALIKSTTALQRAEVIAELGHWRFEVGIEDLFWSSNMFALAGFDPTKGPPSFKAVLQRVIKTDRNAFKNAYRFGGRFLNLGNLTFRYIHPEFGERHFLAVTAIERQGGKEASAIMGVVQDITVAKTTELSLVARSAALADAQEMGRIGDWSYKLGATHIHWSPEIYKLLNCNAESFETTREAVMALYQDDGAERVLQSQAEVMRTGKPTSVDVTARLLDGTFGDFIVTTRGEFDDRGRLTGFVGTIQDISERKLAERELEKLAYYDPLTGLANRALFQRALRRQLMECQEIFQTSALLLLDLDRFKEVNDSLGHAAGDELLVKVAEILRRELPNDAHLARLGGDEFAIILANVSADEAARMAEIIISRLALPVHLRLGEVQIGTSIGIAMMPSDGAQRDVLLRHADLALYNAKDAGRMCYRFFTNALSAVVQEKTALARDLRRALMRDDELFVVFQPQVDVQQGRVTGFEALLRWRHPERGLVPPSDFIPIAESSSLIGEVGLYVLTASCRQLKMWLDLGHPRRDVAVNVSASQIWHSDFEHDVKRILQETGLPPELLTLEVTESVFLREAEGRVRQALVALKSLGVKLALDDFGTGYSSLGYLNRLPFDKLKIDRCFITNVHLNPERLKLLKGIIELGQGLGMTTVAEGAEVMEEVRVLRNLNCDTVQGYVFARPQEGEAVLQTSAMLDLMVPSKAIWSAVSQKEAA